MKKLLTDIELDFYELKCLLEYLDKKPNDSRLYKVAQRSLNLLVTRMSELQKGFDNTYVNMESIVADVPLDANPIEDISASLKQDKLVEDKTDTKSVEEAHANVLVKKESKQLTPVVEDHSVVESAVVDELTAEPGVMFRALSLNDVFRYSRELFSGDTKKLKEVIAEMERLGSYEQSIGFLSTSVDCSLDDFAFQDMDDFLKRFYKL